MTPSKLIKRLRIDDPDHFRLAAFDPADTGGLDKDDAEAMLAALKELEQVRSAGGRRSRASERKEAVDVQGPMTSCTPRRRERILEPQKFNLRGGPMSPIASFSAVLIVATVVAQTAAVAQGPEVKRYNPSEWTKGRFSEVGRASCRERV